MNRKTIAARLATGYRAAGTAMALFLAATLLARAPTAAQTYAITGGTVHTLAGEAFMGTVVIQGGRIVSVGPDVQVPAGAEVVDATGKHVYPGMFEAAGRSRRCGSIPVPRWLINYPSLGGGGGRGFGGGRFGGGGNAVEWALRQEIDFVITGGRGAWKIADYLAENDLFILGRGVSLDNKHKALYEKYQARPGRRIVS